MKASEYGGSDTVKTKGIQPAPHELLPHETLRLMYDTDENDELSIPSPIAAEADK